MKVLLNMCTLTLLFVATCTLQLQGQEVPTTQRPLFTKVTATWCPNCGTWGWEYMENMVASSEEDALIIGAHFSGDLTSSPGDFLADNFAVFGQPRFVLDNTDLGVSRNNISDKETEARNVIVAEVAKEARINVGMEATIGEESIDVKSNVKNFVPLDGDYYLALYLIEDGVIANQASVGPEADHPFVARATFNIEDFGTQLFNGPITELSYEANNSLAIDPEWNLENLYVYGIIWKKEDDTYIYENGNSVKVEGMSTSATDHGVLAEITVGPTISSGNYTFFGDLKILSQTKIDVRDVTGKVIKQLSAGEVSDGTILDLNSQVNGYYVVTMTSGSSQKAVRILKQ